MVLKAGQPAPHAGVLMYEDGYQYVSAAVEQGILLEGDLYTCNENLAKKGTNPILVGVLGLTLGAGVGLALKDQTDFYKYLVGIGAGSLLVLSFK